MTALRAATLSCSLFFDLVWFLFFFLMTSEPVIQRGHIKKRGYGGHITAIRQDRQPPTTNNSLIFSLCLTLPTTTTPTNDPLDIVLFETFRVLAHQNRGCLLTLSFPKVSIRHGVHCRAVTARVKDPCNAPADSRRYHVVPARSPSSLTPATSPTSSLRRDFRRRSCSALRCMSHLPCLARHWCSRGLLAVFMRFTSAARDCSRASTSRL